jgi:tryptophan synthase alpha chain
MTGKMNRIDKLFQTKKKNILSIYFTAGYPSTNSTTDIIKHLVHAGVDMIEIGIPFSDPLADGPVIQKSSEVALRNGMTLNLLFQQLHRIRNEISIPLILMGYINPVLKFGIEEFCRISREIGIDGLILPDLTPEIYNDQYPGLFESHNLHNILLISPQTSDSRIRMIDTMSSGFVYVVSSSSTTGVRKAFSENQLSYLRKIESMNLKNPRIIGFGISDKNSFQQACSLANGAIIGSAFINMLGVNGPDAETISRFIAEILG